VDKENQYEVLMPNDSYRFPERPNVRYRLLRFPVFKRRFWEQVAPLVVGRYDLLHLPYDSCVAWETAKLVVTVHDLKPLMTEGTVSHRNIHGLLERLLVRDRWGRIDHVLTVSQCSRRDIIQRLGVAADRVTVAYPGVDLERFHPSPPPQADADARPYVLCVAGADPTKNVETLVDAFARLPLSLRDAHELVLVGDFRRRQDIRDRVTRVGIEKQSIFTGVVTDERLIELYQRAALFVFPSRYEGFGLPVLEAMACGCPVVSSNASSLPEVAGDAAILFDPLDVAGMTRAMDQVLSDSDLRQALRAKGLVQAAKFSWDQTARDIVAVYQKVAS